ncbi:MAG: ROK family protein [Verrucomicrobiota bacterium]
MKLGIGIDLGGTTIKGAAFDLATGKLLGKDTLPTWSEDDDKDSPGFVARVAELVEGLEEQQGESAGVLGISAPGLAARDSLRIDFMPGRLEALEGLEWGQVLGRDARVLNDAHAALMGEVWQGAARRLQDVFLLTLGTGVGGAVLSDGKLLQGHLGRAGHLGHIALDFHGAGDICGTPGSLEEKVGNYSVGDRSDGRFDSTHALVEAMHSGDEEAAEIWEESMKALAAGVASLVNVLDPEVVLIGGGISQAWEDIEKPLATYLDSFEWRPGGHAVEVRRAALGEWAGTYGAVYFAMQQTT